jgi:hypothetical protein
VNGREAVTIRTSENLVGVPLQAGTSDIRVDYPGSRALRWAYGFSMGSWLVVVVAALGLPLDRLGRWRAHLAGVGRLADRYLAPVLAAVATATALVLYTPKTWQRAIVPEPGARRLVVMLPLGKEMRSEPLVTTGHAGAGDVIYVSFLGGNRVAVGYDKWGIGASVSAPFEVDFTRPQTIEIAMGSLAREGWWRKWEPQAPAPGVSVRWNGRPVLFSPREPYPRGSKEAEIGTNSIGASSCGPVFTGRILDVALVERQKP